MSTKKHSETLVATPLIKEVGQPQLPMYKSYINDSTEDDLAPPNLFYTTDRMMLEPAVSQPYELSKSLETISLAEGLFEGTGSSRSDKLADYGNYLIHSIGNATWFEVCSMITKSMKDGFSLQEMTLKRETKGKYKGDYKISRLSNRPAKSVNAWVWDKYQREVLAVVQHPLRVTNDIVKKSKSKYRGHISPTKPLQTFIKENKYPVIPMKRLLHSRYNPEGGNPQGRSAFINAFIPWQEKIILSKYLVVGVTRDLGGTGVLRLDSEFIKKAKDPDNKYPIERSLYQEIILQMEKMTAGESSFFVLPSDLVEGSTSTYSYDMKLLGVEGGGKQFDINKIVEQKVNEIHNAFGCGFLGLGQNGQTGAYNLATAGMTTHHFFIERDLIYYCSIIRDQILRRVLDEAGIEYSIKDLPVFKYREPDQMSPDDLGKLVQRMKSVGGLTTPAIEHLYKKGGLPTEGVEELEFFDKGESRSGEGLGTSGTGDSQQSGSNSPTNTENKHLNLVANQIGDQIALVDTETDKVFQIVDK